MNDSALAYNTITPVEIRPPGVWASISTSALGVIPVELGKKRFCGGLRLGTFCFQVAMTSCGVSLLLRRQIRYVFCHIWPKPCSGPNSRRPWTFKARAPAGISSHVQPINRLSPGIGGSLRHRGLGWRGAWGRGGARRGRRIQQVVRGLQGVGFGSVDA